MGEREIAQYRYLLCKKDEETTFVQNPNSALPSLFVSSLSTYSTSPGTHVTSTLAAR